MRPEVHTNGNGVASNGLSQKPTRTRNRQEEETVRLIIQALGDMGYSSAVQTLSQESGVNVESALVEEFRNAVLHGDWETAERTVSKLELSRPEDEPVCMNLDASNLTLITLACLVLSTRTKVSRAVGSTKSGCGTTNFTKRIVSSEAQCRSTALSI